MTPPAATSPGFTPPASPLVARALLLGERIEHRRVSRLAGVGTDPIQLALPDGLVGFAFRWGAVVLFGASPAQEAAVLADLAPLVSQKLATPMDETARLELIANPADAEEDRIDAAGTIRLREFSLPRLAMVADALAKSAALSQQEATLSQTLDGMEPVVAGLRAQGRLGVSSRALLRLIGTAISARSRASGRVQAEDKPDLLWDHPELERLHARLADEYELAERSTALDRKLSLVGDTVETLLSLIEARRSLGLEVAIVLLITIEVIVTFYELLF
jgi:uncharacterized Rmd1/YagE family protein